MPRIHTRRSFLDWYVSDRTSIASDVVAEIDRAGLVSPAHQRSLVLPTRIGRGPRQGGSVQALLTRVG